MTESVMWLLYTGIAGIGFVIGWYLVMIWAHDRPLRWRVVVVAILSVFAPLLLVLAFESTRQATWLYLFLLLLGVVLHAGFRGWIREQDDTTATHEHY